LVNLNLGQSKALILAAGRGERMRPLTDSSPKPLLSVKGKPILSWHLQALLRAGHKKVVVNTAWLEEKIVNYYKDQFTGEGDDHPLHIQYSLEGRDFGHALETAGGIVRALPLLDSVFWVVAGDIFIPGFTFPTHVFERFKSSPYLAHLFLVPNPPHNPLGDFGLTEDNMLLNVTGGDLRPKFTYSSIGIFKKSLFQTPFCTITAGNDVGTKAALAPVLRAAADKGLISAELLQTEWTDVGTPQRLEALNLT